MDAHLTAQARPIKIAYRLLAAIAIAGLLAFAVGKISLLTPDQSGHRFFDAGDYEKAAQRFADPMWKGIALFESGEFKEAAGVFAGFDSADGAFNQGNALVMQGKYEEAVGRYTRALELNPDWEAAATNREIAVSRAASLKKEGGNMTDGKMGADEITFEKGESPPSDGFEETDEGQEMSESDMRSVWLRQVQTKPADFLRAKFAYQHAAKKAQSE
jgi:Ca-activated chloride channel family protein